jgi:hypothetical protein
MAANVRGWLYFPASTPKKDSPTTDNGWPNRRFKQDRFYAAAHRVPARVDDF